MPSTLSVVVPCYNAQLYLPDLVSTLRPQASDDIEFIFVDDCSTDETPSRLAAITETLPNARHLTNPSNAGPSVSRNTGTAAAQGDYITYLDSDDWIGPGYLAQLVDRMDRYGADFLRVDVVEVTERRRGLRRCPVGRRGEVLDPRSVILPADAASSVDYPFPWAGIYRRELADRGLLTFEPALRTAEDREWIWRLHREASSMVVLGALLGLFYRRGVAGSLTQSGREDQLHFLDSMRMVVAQTRADRDAELFLPKAISNFAALMLWHLKRRARLTPELQRTLLRRIGTELNALPQDHLDRYLASVDVVRRGQLRLLQAGDTAGLRTLPLRRREASR